METFIRIVEKCVTEGYAIVSTDDDKVVASDKCIVVSTKLWNDCPAETELRNTLTKRLDNKRKGQHVQLSAVAVCALCSPGYSVNHISMSGVTMSDMKTVWGFIETSMVSSSSALSEWMRKTVGDRSQDGYCVNIDAVSDGSSIADISYRPMTVNNMVKPRGRTTPINPYAAALEYGSGYSITSLAIADSIMLNALRFNDMKPAPRVTGPTWGRVTIP